MNKFRKKPVVIEAMQLAPGRDGLRVTVGMLFDFLDCAEWETNAVGGVDIKTLEGVMTANPGDWIIKGVAGEFYPCKPDIFAATYEPAGDPRMTTRQTPDAVREAVARIIYGRTPDANPFDKHSSIDFAYASEHSRARALEMADAILAALDSRAGDAGEGAACPQCEGSGVGTVSDCCFVCGGEGGVAATPAPAVDAVELAAFGASEHACALYPGQDQAAERAAFIAGAAQFAENAKSSVDAPTERQVALAKLTAMDDDGFPDEPLPISRNAVDAVPAGEVERIAIREFLIACADAADFQASRDAGSLSQVKCRAEAKAYRNAARMIFEQDHASCRSASLSHGEGRK